MAAWFGFDRDGIEPVDDGLKLSRHLAKAQQMPLLCDSSCNNGASLGFRPSWLKLTGATDHPAASQRVHRIKSAEDPQVIT
jgi:hypothetical protein